MMAQLAIKKDPWLNSWHYRYYSFLNRILGFSLPEEKQSFHLCPYFQFIFWISIGLFVISIPLLIGWVGLKLVRSIYKFFSCFSFGKKFIDIIDVYFNIGGIIDGACVDLKERPVPILVFSFLISCLFIFLPLILYCFVMIALHVGFFIIFYIPISIWYGLLYCGMGCFYVFGSIGFVFNWLFSPQAILIYLFIVKWGGISIVTLGLIAILSWLLYKMCQSQFVKKYIWDYFIFKYNGYLEARKNAIERQGKKEAEKREQKTKMEQKEIIKPGPFQTFLSTKWKNIKSVWKQSAILKGKNTKVEVLGVLGALWETTKGGVKGLCPVIILVEEEEIEEE